MVIIDCSLFGANFGANKKAAMRFNFITA